MTPGQGATISATKPLKTQLAEIGYKPANITYLGFPHYHSGPTATANFGGSTWLVRQAERDTATYEKLKGGKTTIIKTPDYDVFGDGNVIIKSAPGIAGDPHHYPEERTTGKPQPLSTTPISPKHREPQSKLS